MTTLSGARFSNLIRFVLVMFIVQLACAAEELNRTGKAEKNNNPDKQVSRQVQPAPLPVPAQPLDVILGQPTKDSVVFSFLRYEHDGPVQVTLQAPANDSFRSVVVTSLQAGMPVDVTVADLQADTLYRYEVVDSETRARLAFGAFHTQRLPGSEFTFTVTADSHLDKNADAPLYLQTLANIAGDQPDFHIDLGDTFMTGKHANRENAFAQYLAQRYYFSQLKAPLFLVLGNHDGEEAKQRKGGMNSVAVWSAHMRTRYFPNPQPDDFYTGNGEQEPGIGYLEDYYAWRWGDAEFFVLNPYWQASAVKGDERWSLSLGETQYKWLRDSLAASTANYKFIFIHQMIGGLDRNGRGGIEGAPYGEWGGKSASGENDFAVQRPGWDEPVHSLLVKHGVSAVFHGHDHLYATETLDGIIYQLVPQPAHLSFAPPKDAVAYGYTSGTVLGGSGHMRVRVSPEGVSAEFVRADIVRDGQQNRNGEVLHSYRIE